MSWGKFYFESEARCGTKKTRETVTETKLPGEKPS